MRFSSLTFVLSSLLGVGLFSGCERVVPVEQANRAQILLVGNGAEPASLDPHIATGVPERSIIFALLEGLMRPHPETLAPMPGMAARYELTDDQKTYRFYLREDALWSNEDPVTAHDFVFAYQRILSPRLGAQYASLLYCMENAEAYHAGEIDDFARVGVKAISASVLEITLNAPTPFFLSLIMHYTWFPVHAETILAHGGMTNLNNRWTRPGNFVGNGPFILKSWQVKEVVTVEKNPDYYAATTVRLKGIHFYAVSNLNTEERMFRAGQLHITHALPTHKFPTYRRNQSPALRVEPALGTYYYLFNTQRSPLNDPRVRQALNLAIDRSSIIENVLKGNRSPAYTFTPPGTGGYTCSTAIIEDIQSARKLLAEAGYPDGQGFPEQTLLYNSSEDHRILAEAIQGMWKAHLNIAVSLMNQEWKVYLETRKSRDFDIVRAGWLGDYNDPSTFLELFTSQSGNNVSGWSNPEYDALIASASRTIDRELRFNQFQQAEALLLKEMPLMPIYFYNTTSLVHPAVRGWHGNLLDWHPYQSVYLDANFDARVALNL